MTVQEFIEGYQSSTDKDIYVQNHITTEYIPYFQKVEEAKRIVETTSYKTINDRKVFWQDSPMKGIFFICRLISDYTDIDLGNDPMTAYDELTKNGLITQIAAYIPQSEYKEFSTILQMVYDDLIENTRSLAGYLDIKFDSLEKVLGAILENETIQKLIEESNNLTS